MTEENTPDPNRGAEAGPQEQASPAPPPSTRQPGGKVLGIVALVVALAAGSVSGYLWYQIKVEQRLSQNQLLLDIKETANASSMEVSALDNELEALQTRQQDQIERVQSELAERIDSLENSQASLADSHQSLAERHDALAERSETLAERHEALSSSIEQVYEELDRSLESWALEEVEQLLRIANHSLQLSEDIDTAIAGLELADQRLEEIGNPAFLPVRERLASHISTLKSLERVDIAGVSLRLAGMAETVQNLPLDQETSRPIAGASADNLADLEPSQWLEAGNELLEDLKKLVRIQNIEEPAKPLLAPEQRYFLFSNLRLMLSGAQIAAMRRDTGTYQENLERAAQWLNEYFDTGQQGVSELLADIEAMSGHKLDPELPDISDTLAALRQAKARMKAQ